MTKLRYAFWIVFCTGSASIVGLKMMHIYPSYALAWIVSGLLLAWLFELRKKRE